MAYDNDYITANLNRLYAIWLTQRRQRQTRQQWLRHPALSGRSVTDVAAIVADAHHPDHNDVAGALLAAHRSSVGPASETAMVLLLCAARPLVLVLDPADRYGDSRASVWAVMVNRLNSLEPQTVAASPVPFLVALLGRVRPDASRYPSEPAGPDRGQRRRARTAAVSNL